MGPSSWYGRPSLPLPVPFFALAGSGLRLRVLPDVPGERPPDIIALGESALLVPADESLVRAGVDQLSVAGLLLHGGKTPDRRCRRPWPPTRRTKARRCSAWLSVIPRLR